MVKMKYLLPLVLLSTCLLQAQVVTTFEGMNASQLASPRLPIDPNGAVGTKQYMEWVNGYYQAYDKVTFARVWSSPQPVSNLPWAANKMPQCASIGVDTVILFDRLALRWVVAGHTNSNYTYCVAISNTDDLTSTNPPLNWYTYSFALSSVLGQNSQGHPYYPDYTKMSTWSDAYYMTADLEDPNNGYIIIGVLACALDRTNMINGGTPNPIQCFSDPNPIPKNGTWYVAHTLNAADVEGTTPPPQGRDEFLTSIVNPPNDGHSTTSNTMNLWDLHLDWTNSANSTFTKTTLSVPTYTPGCYNPANVAYTICVPEPTLTKSGIHYHIDSVGDRIMPRLGYRNFGSYESFLGSQTIRVGTGFNHQSAVSWFELRGSGVPNVYQTGIVDPDKTNYRFMPSIAQDHVGNAAVGYSVSSGLKVHPGIRAAWWNLPGNTSPTEITMQIGRGDQLNSSKWGDYTSMTVDPVDGCTFWYVNQYFPVNQTSTFNWHTKIAHFRLSSCN
jgi:hypothetical protein